MIPRALKRTVRAWLSKNGIEVFRPKDQYARDGLFTLHSDHFRARPDFRAAYKRGVQASAGVDPGFEWRVHIALWAARRALAAHGDFVECGVNAGFNSSAIMQALDWNTLERRFYLVDTFSGPVLPQYSAEEVEQDRRGMAERAIRAGQYVTDLERIRANFAEWGNAVVVQGAVPDVLGTVGFGPVAFVHIDMNCALPEAAALEFFWQRLSPGGIVLFDDYVHAGHEFQRDAIDRVADAQGIDVLSLPTVQGLVIRG